MTAASPRGSRHAGARARTRADAGGAAPRARPDGRAADPRPRPGEFRAHDLGGGTELAQVRPYEPGDDVRRIDWNVTARTTVPARPGPRPGAGADGWLLLDVSPSMTFGTADRRKADVAEGVALAIGHLATQRGNRLGVVTFGGRSTTGRAAGGGPGRPAARCSRARVDDVAGRRRPDRRHVARRPRCGSSPRRRPRGGLVVARLRLPRAARLAAAARRRRGRAHQVLAVEIRDPREDELPDVGELTLIDAETGREVRVDTSSRALRERFAEAAAAERADARPRAPPARRRPRRPVHLRQLARVARRPAPPPGDRVMTFASPELLARAPPRPARARAATCCVQRRRAATRSGSRTSTCWPTSCRGRPPGGATCRRRCTWPRSRALVLALARPSMMVAVPREEATIILAMDVSRLDDGDRRRARPGWRRPSRPPSDFVDQLPAGVPGRARRLLDRRRASLVAPTTDRVAGPRGARQRSVADGGTALGDAIATCRSRPPADARTTAADHRRPAPRPPVGRRPRRRRRPRRSRRQPPLVATVLLSDGANSTGATRAARRRRRGGRRGRAGLHDRARARGRHRRRPGPDDRAARRRSTSRPTPRPWRRSPRRRAAASSRRRRPRTSPRSTRASARRSATRSRSRRSRSCSPRRACCSCSAAPASPPTGSTGSRSAGSPDPVSRRSTPRPRRIPSREPGSRRRLGARFVRGIASRRSGGVGRSDAEGPLELVGVEVPEG